MKIRVSARAIVISPADNVLVINVRDPETRSGSWLTVPGGGLKLFESAVHAARREVYEEVGIVLGPNHSASPWRLERFHFRGTRYIVLERLVVFVSKAQCKLMIQREELVSASWMPISKLCAEGSDIVPERVIGQLHDFLSFKQTSDG